jgi:hypothetical protein
MIVEHELYIFRDTDCIVYSFTIDENDWQVLTTEVPEALNSIIELSKQCTAYNHEDRPVSDAVVDWLQDFFAHGGVDGGPFTHVSDEDASLQLPPLRPVPVAFINAHNDDADSLDFSLGVSEDTLDFMDGGKPVANYQDDDDLIYSSDPHDDFDKRLESNQQHTVVKLKAHLLQTELRLYLCHVIMVLHKGILVLSQVEGLQPRVQRCARGHLDGCSSQRGVSIPKRLKVISTMEIVIVALSMCEHNVIFPTERRFRLHWTVYRRNDPVIITVRGSYRLWTNKSGHECGQSSS